MDQAYLDKLYAAIESAAHQAAENAGYAGEMSDGGAGRMREQLHFFRCGQEGKIPPEWKKYDADVKKRELESDPEYIKALVQLNNIKARYNIGD